MKMGTPVEPIINNIMKKNFLLLILLLSTMTVVKAQSEVVYRNNADDEITVFCELLGINKNVLGLGNKISVEVDFGDEKNFWGNDGRDVLIDENGKDLKFNSMVDAMNFMGERGWKFEDSYVVTVAKQNVIHWLLSKRIKRGQDARGDMKQKRDNKKKKEKKQHDDNYRNADPLYNW